MSNALAIAAVTAVLRDLLFNGLRASQVVSDIVGGDVAVSAMAPDRVVPAGAEDPTQLNLFLHQVTPNQGWRNVDLPSRNSDGDRIARPPLALDLHYLLTAYGARDLFPELILGHAMQVLHEASVLTRDAIRKALSPNPVPNGFPVQLATSELADQVEQLRITPSIMNTDEVSKLWTALQTHYRPTAAYQVTVVLIETRRSFKSALPVAGRNTYVLPFHQPTIDSVVSEAGDIEPITAGTKLLIKGTQLRGRITQVLVGTIDLTSAITETTDARIKLTLPAALPAGMYAGVQLVQVVHQFALGTPEVPHRGVESNVEAFILRPIIVGPPSLEPGVVSNVVGGVTFKTGQIKIDFNPKVKKTQRVVLLLNEINPPATRPARSYSFRAPAGNGVVDPGAETSSIKITFTSVAAGDYLVRVRVDGGESVLDVDGSGKYATPKVTI